MASKQQQDLVNVLANIHNTAENIILNQLTIGAMSLMIGNRMIDRPISSSEMVDILMEARDNKYERTPISSIIYVPKPQVQHPQTNWTRFKSLFHRRSIHAN